MMSGVPGLKAGATGLAGFSGGDILTDSKMATPCSPTARDAFHDLWHTIHGPGAWDANPEVVALTFSVEQRNIDVIARAA